MGDKKISKASKRIFYYCDGGYTCDYNPNKGKRIGHYDCPYRVCGDIAGECTSVKAIKEAKRLEGER